MAKNKKKKNKKGKKKKNSKLFANLGFDLDAVKNYLPGAWERNLETLRNERNKVNVPSKRPGNIYYNINNAGVVEDTRDFVYEDGTRVARGTEYHIHIDPDTKRETYMTEKIHKFESMKIIRVNGSTLLGNYINIKGNRPEREYLKPYDWSPAKKDIKRGYSIRTFVRQAYGAREVYEISELDAEKSGILYEKISVDWAVGYNQDLVFQENEKNLEILEEAGYVELLDELNEYDGFLGEEDPVKAKLLEMNDAVFRFDPSKLGSKKKKKKKGSKGKKKKKGGSKGSGAGSSGGGSGGGGGAY